MQNANAGLLLFLPKASNTHVCAAIAVMLVSLFSDGCNKRSAWYQGMQLVADEDEHTWL